MVGWTGYSRDVVLRGVFEGACLDRVSYMAVRFGLSF